MSGSPIGNLEMSVVIPVRNRAQNLRRCLDSIISMGVMEDGRNSWHVVVVDDKSDDDKIPGTTQTKSGGTRDVIREYHEKYPQNIIGLFFKDHLERIYAFNAGMRYSTGRWMMHLDSDDALMPHMAQAFRDAMGMNPNAKLFNWGGVIHWRNRDAKFIRTTVRQPFHPPLTSTGVGVFPSGGIFSGGFAFKRELFDQVGYFPDATDPYTFGKKMKQRFPELNDVYPEKKFDLGNPWGQDWAMYYMLTRHENPVVLDQLLHIQYVRQ